MPSIFPDPANGGVVVRDMAGNCLNPPGVTNDYCPPLPFVTTCEVTALPDDCTAHLAASQVNAITSELLSFAVCLDPDGLWNCASLGNLCTAFNAWFASVPISPAGMVAGICADDAVADALAACLISADAGNIVQVGVDGRIYAAPFVPGDAVGAICADDTAADALAACLIDPDAANLLDVGPSGRLFVDPAVVRAALCADPQGDLLAACLISTDVNNIITQGADGRLRALATPINAAATVTAICATDAAADALALCLIDATSPNSLDQGPTGRLIVTPGAVVTDILATDAAADALAAGMIDPVATNLLDLSGAGRLMVDPAIVRAALCADPHGDLLAACLISADGTNTIIQGSDGRLFAPPGAFDPVGAVTAICASDPSADALAACLISTNLTNQLGLGSDGRLFTAAVLPKTYISGYILSNDAGDTANHIGISAGECAVMAGGAAVLHGPSGMVKRMNAAWVAGTNNGGLDTGAIGNGTYHIYAIYNPTTDVSDFCCSLSAAAPTTGGSIPVGFTHFRRIGSFVRIAGANQLFYHDAGAPNDFYLRTPVQESALTNPGTAAVLTTLTTVPAGISVKAKLTGQARHSAPTVGILFYISSPLVTDVAAGTGGAITIQFSSSGSTGPQSMSYQMDILTNTSRQVRSRLSVSDANMTTNINCYGWADSRGQ